MIQDPEFVKKRQSIIDVGQLNQLEMVQAELRRNVELLTSLRRENKELRSAMQQALRGQRNLNTDDHYAKEEELLHNKMCVLKRSLNAVKGKNAELMKEIDKTAENTAYVLMEGGATIDEGSSIAQKIRALENRLDKCLIKHNEVDAIRRTYETLLERLQLEQSGFDIQLAATEKTLMNKIKDLGDLMSVQVEAAKGCDQAKAEVAHLKAKLSEERRTQRKDTDKRRKFVQEKRNLLEKKHNTLMLKIAQQEERHARLLQQNSLNNTTTSKRRGHRGDTASAPLPPDEVERLQRQKESYQRLRDVSMATNVTEVVQKLLERRESNLQLQGTVRELEATIDLQRKEKENLQRRWDELNQQAGGAMVSAKVTRTARNQHQRTMLARKNSGESENAETEADYRLLGDRSRENRRIIEEFENHLQLKQAELKEAQSKQEVLTQLLLDVEVGVHHLATKLSVLRYDEVAPSAALPPSAQPAETDSSRPTTAPLKEIHETVDILRSCDAKIQLMMEEISLAEVNQAARAVVRSRPSMAETNIRIPAASSMMTRSVTLAGPARSDRTTSQESSSEEEAGNRASRPGWLGAPAIPAFQGGLVEDFPDNEIHDRQELKLMALATVEREEKKAKKQLQQRRKEEAS